MSHDRGHGVYTMTAIVLRYPSGREEFAIPGLHQESLELEDRPFDFVPRDILPCIHRTSCRVHAVCTPTGPSTFHTTGRPSAYPRAFPETFAPGAIPPQRP